MYHTGRRLTILNEAIKAQNLLPQKQMLAVPRQKSRNSIGTRYRLRRLTKDVIKIHATGENLYLAMTLYLRQLNLSKK
jgi:hypothetical protein